MIWTEIRLKIMRSLLTSSSRRLDELAQEVGFKNPQALIHDMNALIRRKYVVELPQEKPVLPTYGINQEISAIVHLYNDRHYRGIRDLIRSYPSVAPDITRGYTAVSDCLLSIIREMIVCSHSFFEYILQNPTPDGLKQTFRYMVYPFRMIPGISEEFTFILLIHELYAVALSIDLKKGGLGNDFCEPLKTIRSIIKERYEMTTPSDNAPGRQKEVV